MTAIPRLHLEKGRILMGLLDKLLGVSNRKPKKIITDPAALARIEQTQQELEARLNAIDQRLNRVENVILPKGD